jgi:DNA-binding CsgD family transcriptional regulator
VPEEVIGRAPELSAIDRLLSRAVERPAALLLEGPAGIGKSILWEAARTAAGERGFRVLATRPTPSESAIPLVGFGDLFSVVPAEVMRGLAEPQRRALEIALLKADPNDVAPDRRAVSVATVALLAALATTQGPVLLAVDDVQWLDESSAALIAFALRRLGGHPMGVILSQREPVPSPGPLGIEAAVPGDRFERCTLGPLPLAALHRIFADRLGHRFSRLTLVKIEEASGGNPFFALEIARALIRSGAPVAPGRPLPVPETLDALTQERVASMPEPTRRALTVVALAAEPSLEVLARSGIEDPEGALEPAVRDGVVLLDGQTVSFAHPLLSSTVLARSDPATLRAVHARLATAVTSEEARARHTGLAAAGPDAAAARALEDAAHRAASRGAPGAAAELLELARALTPAGDTADRGRRAFDAARCHFDAGETDSARVLLEEHAPTLDPGAERARALQLLGQVLARSASFREALALALEAVGEADDDPLLRAGIELDVAYCNVCLGDFGEAASHATAAAALSEQTQAGGLLGEALAALVILQFLGGGGMDDAGMARAMELEDPQRPGPWEMRPSFVRALLLLWSARLAEALAALGDLRAEALERGQETVVPSLDLYLVLASLWSGRTRDAVGYAEEARDVASLIGDPVTEALALTSSALVDAYVGEADDARSRATAALELLFRSQWMLYTTWPLAALGFLEVSLEEPAQADVHLRPLADLFTAMPFGDPILGIFLPDAVEAAIALGDLDRAAAYVAWLEERNRPLERPWAEAMTGRCGGMLAAARGDLDGALAALERAMTAHDRLPMPFERARTLLIKGQVHRRRREKRLADEALREAHRVFEDAGTPLWAERTRAELDRVGLRPRAPEGLTPTERRVAELAAAGLTNRQVADAAFLSPKTVGNVLGRVYRKLGIGSRAELGARMSEVPPAE